MTDAPDHSHIANSGRAELSLDQLAILHGGLAHFMLEVSARATRLHQAGLARNARVARHQLSELSKVLRLSTLVRPEYTESMEAFINEDLTPIQTLVSEGNWDEFDEAWERLTVAVNRYHDEYNHGYLVWRVPTEPSDLDLTPRD